MLWRIPILAIHPRNVIRNLISILLRPNNRLFKKREIRTKQKIKKQRSCLCKKQSWIQNRRANHTYHRSVLSPHIWIKLHPIHRWQIRVFMVVSRFDFFWYSLAKLLILIKGSFCCMLNQGYLAPIPYAFHVLYRQGALFGLRWWNSK